MLELNPSTLKVNEPSAPFLIFILGLLTFADRKPFPDFQAKISMEMVCRNISIAKHPLAMEMESVYKTTT
mgnify:CR=1 FL=1